MKKDKSNSLDPPGCHPCADDLCEGQIHRAGILTDYEIQQYKLIPDIAPECLKGATYNLRLGEGHYVFIRPEKKKTDGWPSAWIDQFRRKHELGNWSTVWLDQTRDKLEEKNKLNPQFKYAESLIIDPFSAALIQLKETVDTRSCINDHDLLVCGRFDLRLSMVAKGLISQQATQVEPNYKGKLFCYLFNQTAGPIILNYEEEIATIEFSYVSCAIHNTPAEKKDLLQRLIDSSRIKYQKKDGSNSAKIFCTEHGIDDVRYFGPNVDGDRKLPNHGSSFTDYIDNQVDDVVAEKLSKQLNKYLKILIGSVVVFTVLVALFGNDWAGRYFRGKAKDEFTTYWKENTIDRDKILREEINKKIDTELKKRNILKQRGQPKNEK